VNGFQDSKLIHMNPLMFQESDEWELYEEPKIKLTFEKWIAKQDGGYIVVEGHKQKLRIIYGESLYRLIDTYEVEL